MASLSLQEKLAAVYSGPVKILCICGSLRKASCNLGLIRYISSNAPKGTQVTIADISGIPLFNADIQYQDDESKDPPSVIRLRKQIRESDAVLFGSTEYNYSVSGVLKNAIDWGSRSQNGNAFKGKCASIISGAGGLGGSRSQYHLRQICVFLDLRVMNNPECLVKNFEKGNFDLSTGDLISAKWKERLITHCEALRDWTKQCQMGQIALESFSSK